MYTRILIPTDGSELASRGVEHGFALAAALKVPVTVVFVRVPLTGFALGGIVRAESLGEYEEGVDREIRDLEQAVRRMAVEAGVASSFVTRTDPSPAQAILDIAGEEACDLIVISSHGRRGISLMLLGSQTAEVLSRAEVPVLVVR
jgi:nucleotide-binding universal stress UspA family protein